MRIAFFTSTFLEPTHHAIASVIAAFPQWEYFVYANKFLDKAFFAFPNVARRILYRKGPLHGLEVEKCDLVHAVYDGEIALRAVLGASELNVPAVLSFHGGFDTKSKIHDPFYREVTGIACNKAATVSVVSQAEVQLLRCIGIDRDIRVIPVPIDEHLLPSPGERDPYRLIFVGRLIPKKGADTALHALARLPHQYQLIIVGDGPEQPVLHETATLLGIDSRVSWRGLLPLEETLHLMNTSGILIHPSRVAADGNTDGTPQVILWAQALRLPVIATHTGSIHDIIEHEETGLLVPPDHPAALADAVQRLEHVPGLAQNVTESGRSRVLRHHTLASVCQQWHTVYSDVAARNQRKDPAQ